MNKQEDLFGGRLDRDMGIDKVLNRNPDWEQRGMDFIIKLPRGWTGTGQKIRILATPVIGEPTHPNAWGALISRAKRLGILVPTGKQEQAKIRASHGRKNDIYRR